MSIAPAATDISAKAVPAEEEAPENTKVTGAWFNRVPPGWQAAPIKRLFRLVNGATPAADEATYWGGEIAWATPDDLGSLTGSRLRTTARTLSRDGYANCGASIVPAESLVLSTRAPIGHVAIADGPMCTNQGCRSLVAWRPVSATYFYYQLLAARPLLESLGNGSTFKELRGSELGRVVVALPPLPEQRAIATFLDERTRRIDELIEKKRRLLALLDEQRTALITRAVTKGLNPDAPMKPSGIDWLGDVPRHWSVTGLKRLCSGWCDGPFGSSLKSEHYTEHGVRVVRLQNIGEGEFNAGDAAYIGEDYYSILGDHDVEAGDVLVAGLGDNAHPVGRSCTAPQGIGRAMVKADCFRFRVLPARADASYLANLLSAFARLTPGRDSTGTTRSRLNLVAISNRAVLVPPLSEQRLIVSHLVKHTAKITRAESHIRAALCGLAEYRQALISAAVTGVITVGQ